MLLGEYYAKFLGLMMFSSHSNIEQAALSRADTQEDERVDCFVSLEGLERNQIIYNPPDIGEVSLIKLFCAYFFIAMGSSLSNSIVVYLVIFSLNWGRKLPLKVDMLKVELFGKIQPGG